MDQIVFLRNNPGAYDAAVHESVHSGRKLTIITKEDATEKGRSMAVIAFAAQIDGDLVPVQFSTTVRVLADAFQILNIIARSED